MNQVKDRLVETMVELVVAKRSLRSMKQERKAQKGTARDNTDREIETIKQGIKAAKKEMDALASQLADASDESIS